MISSSRPSCSAHLSPSVRTCPAHIPAYISPICPSSTAITTAPRAAVYYSSPPSCRPHLLGTRRTPHQRPLPSVSLRPVGTSRRRDAKDRRIIQRRNGLEQPILARADLASTPRACS
ncbi:hypothetical protein BD413DRAFT_516265 [Trametes elegans]|nr:hypothetical protein BD413DRAFT_516265 [Trametes elegans]